MPAFNRYIGIDYSGAETPIASLRGLRVYMAQRSSPPVEVQPPPSPRKYWTRRGIAEWLVERLAEDVPTLVGIDHGLSFPLRYFETHGLIDGDTIEIQGQRIRLYGIDAPEAKPTCRRAGVEWLCGQEAALKAARSGHQARRRRC